MVTTPSEPTSLTADGAATSPDGAATKTNVWRRMASRLTSSMQDADDAQDQQRCTAYGGTPCASLHGRSRVTLVGTLRSVAMTPRGGVPALNAQLCDGSGRVDVVWLGRRRIAGIDAGRRIKVTGLVAVHEDRAVMYNPWYELLPAAAQDEAEVA